VVKHASLLQTYGSQTLVVGGRQDPAPLQSGGWITAWPEQAPPPQIVDEFGNVHCVALSAVHCAAQGPTPAHEARPPCGRPDVTAVHKPGRVTMSQASHCPEHARSQHTPSTQKPVRHCAPLEQGCPMMSSGVQMPARQNWSVAQFASVVQLPPQRVPEQPKVPHDTCWGAGQRPEPLHVAAMVATLAAQLAARHEVSAAG
jgi:hypothetical protein